MRSRAHKDPLKDFGRIPEEDNLKAKGLRRKVLPKAPWEALCQGLWKKEHP